MGHWPSNAPVPVPVPADRPYSVELSHSVKRALAETLPESVAFAVVEFAFGPLAANPHRVGAALKPPSEGYHRARRGEYRVRYRIDEDRHRVLVVDVDHRRDAYHT